MNMKHLAKMLIFVFHLVNLKSNDEINILTEFSLFLAAIPFRMPLIKIKSREFSWLPKREFATNASQLTQLD